jgi:16S rRNA processing protein RimM
MSAARRRTIERAREPVFLLIGRVLRPHGVRGSLLVEPLSEIVETIPAGSTVYLGPERRPARTVGMLRHGRMYRMQIVGCEDRDAAEAFRGMELQIEVEERPPLPPGRYYHWQVIGLRVATEAGEPLGEIRQILETGANDVYVVATPDGSEILLPAITSVVRGVDLEAGVMTVHMLPGLEEVTRRRGIQK